MSFLESTSENADFNQYWYSEKTIQALVQELEEQATSVAFVSTPSVFFSLPADSPLRSSSKVLDFDEQWSHLPCFVRYDFNEPDKLPKELQGTFDALLIDPPFITEEVWAKYAITAKLLLRPGGKVICSTIAENRDMMKTLLDLERVAFRPSIPNLIYQYDLYTNFTPSVLCHANPEIPCDD